MRRVRTTLILALHAPFMVAGAVYQVMAAGFSVGRREAVEKIAAWLQ